MEVAVCSSNISPRRTRLFDNSSRRYYRRNPSENQAMVMTHLLKNSFSGDKGPSPQHIIMIFGKSFYGIRLYHLNVVTPAVDADTLAIVTSELVRKTGAQLKLNAVIRRDKPDMQKT